LVPSEWMNIESDTIGRVKFVPNKYDLRGDCLVEFRTGKVYKYRDVPAHKVENLVHSSSSGEYFHNNIKPYHDGEKI